MTWGQLHTFCSFPKFCISFHFEEKKNLFTTAMYMDDHWNTSKSADDLKYSNKLKLILLIFCFLIVESLVISLLYIYKILLISLSFSPCV